MLAPVDHELEGKLAWAFLVEFVQLAIGQRPRQLLACSLEGAGHRTHVETERSPGQTSRRNERTGQIGQRRIETQRVRLAFSELRRVVLERIDQQRHAQNVGEVAALRDVEL